MGAAFKFERRLLDENEWEPVARSHYPILDSLTREEALDLARWLRERRARAQGLVRQTTRVRRGKAEPRGAAPPEPHAERGLAGKKQIFARALKRVNSRLAIFATEARRARALASLRAALEARREAPRHHPEPGRTASPGMPSKPNRRRRRGIDPRQVGSVSQAVRDAQVVRDSRAR
jgi:hypothetical protein